MLRSWHEKGKILERWRQLRLVMAYSTECYVPLDMNQSPFNAGVPIELKEFDAKQVNNWVWLHGITWTKSQVDALMKMLGGHPTLVGLALYEVGSGKMSLDRLLQSAPTEAGLYSSHLRRHLETLKSSPALWEAFRLVVESSEPVELTRCRFISSTAWAWYSRTIIKSCRAVSYTENIFIGCSRSEDT